MNRKSNAEHTARNPFKNGIRGNVKSNAQVDNFNKSQEVFKMLQTTLGTPAVPAVSTSFRIPRKHSPPKTTTNVRDINQKLSTRDQGDSFHNKQARRDNPKQNEGRNSNAFSRREKTNGKESMSLSKDDSLRKRCHDSSPVGDIKSPKAKYSANSDSIDKCNKEKLIRGSEQKNMSSGNKHSLKVSTNESKSSSIEVYVGNPFSNASNIKSRDSFSPGQRLSLGKEVQKGLTADNSQQSRDILNENEKNKGEESEGSEDNNSNHLQEGDNDNSVEQRRLRKERATMRKKLRKAEYGKPWVFSVKQNGMEANRITEENKTALYEKILSILEETFLSDRLDNDTSYPQYFGYTYKNNTFSILSANFSSREYMRDKLSFLHKSGESVTLICTAVTYDDRYFDVKVNKRISHFSEFRALCEKDNSDINTTTWRLIEYEDDVDDNNVRLYTIGMEPECYERIRKDLKGVLRCGDEDVHFVSSIRNIPVDYKRRKMYLQEEKEKYGN